MNKFFYLLFALLCCHLTAAEKPNVVIIFIDDMGYADIGPFMRWGQTNYYYCGSVWKTLRKISPLWWREVL